MRREKGLVEKNRDLWSKKKGLVENKRRDLT